MKLRNKKTGEVVDFGSNKWRIMSPICEGNSSYEELGAYDTLAEFNDEWEDYEEPKKDKEPKKGVANVEGPTSKFDKSVLIEYYSLEEAEKAVEKLKACKRLKDKGFRFDGIKEDYTRILQQQDPFRTGRRYLLFNKSEDEDWMKEHWDDLDLLFGEEEE